jgi:N-dimethylarginine dimethylaminohydrolase
MVGYGTQGAVIRGQLVCCQQMGITNNQTYKKESIMILRHQEKERQRRKRVRFLVCEPPPHMRAGGGKHGNMLAKRAQRGGGINPRKTAHGWARFMRRLMGEFDAELVVIPAPPPPLYDTVFPRDTYFVGPDGKIHRAKMVADYRRSDPFYICAHLQALGLEVVDDLNHVMEGRSCFHVLPNETAIIYCPGARAEPKAADDLRRIFGVEVLVVELVHEFFFHADVAGMALSGREPAVFWCRESLARPDDWDLIRDACRYDKSTFVQASKEDALRYAMNTRVMNGYQVIAPPGMSVKYVRDVNALGYEVHMIDLGPLHTGCGGFISCTTNDFPDSFYKQRVPEQNRGENALTRFEQAIASYPRREMVLGQI